MGQICALLANIHRDPKKSSPFKPSDFMPNIERDQGHDRATVARDAIKTLDGLISRQSRNGADA